MRSGINPSKKVSKKKKIFSIPDQSFPPPTTSPRRRRTPLRIPSTTWATLTTLPTCQRPTARISASARAPGRRPRPPHPHPPRQPPTHPRERLEKGIERINNKLCKWKLRALDQTLCHNWKSWLTRGCIPRRWFLKRVIQVKMLQNTWCKKDGTYIFWPRITQPQKIA